jgi:regulator of protease activity HflC (stomatin/prohibitin superfamily)
MYLSRVAGIGFMCLLVLGLFLAIMGSWYTVPEGYRGVIVRNGAVVGEAAPGLGFKIPLIDGVVDMSVQTEKVQFDSIQAYSRDIQQADVVASVNVRLAPDRVLDMYSTVGTGYGSKLLLPVVQKRIKEVFGQYAAAEVIGAREKVSGAILALISTDMAGRGLIVESLQIENIDFSDGYEDAAEAAAKAEADVKRARQELEHAKVNAQRQVAEAEAKAQATRATADAEAYATKARGEAEASAIKARGEAEASAIRARAEPLRANPDLIALIAAERWDGKLPATMVPGAAVPFISVAK